MLYLMNHPPSRKDSLDDDDVGILQEYVDEASQKKENDQEETILGDSKEEEIHEPQVLEKKPSFPRERLYIKDGEIISGPNQGIKTRFSYIVSILHFSLILSLKMLKRH